MLPGHRKAAQRRLDEAAEPQLEAQRRWSLGGATPTRTAQLGPSQPHNVPMLDLVEFLHAAAHRVSSAARLVTGAWPPHRRRLVLFLRAP